VAQVIDGVVDILAHFEMTFAAAGQLVIERIRQPCQFGLRNQVVSDAASLSATR